MCKQLWAGRLVIVAALALNGCSGGRPPLNLGVTEGRLAPCPDSPNCVSSQAADENQRIEALRYTGDTTQARNRLLAVLNRMERVHLRQADADYLHAEFSSAWFGFIDDVEFQFNPPGVIQARSASRTGYYDFGVNRERVNAIRAQFDAPR
ncbi:DUF1499 domain-containing protein [Candidatus Contendibacter odensensis]|uniref:DUF1499 domain-containing protein n=1 Tax=Candidatus Contendobacter odensis Run_B_J11 TaxID=1400861 RepID=A0A7U7G8L6_9GAMM|nr:DUF1499 domain-containing protein [Candidatus Contendobacter odensis]CDH43708.1 conserved hypothetical protein [Candidatus Contendobacter odensis Run_B_J11]